MEECQEKLKDTLKDKDSIEKDIAKREEEIKAFEILLKQNQEQFERVQLKLLSYRKEDIMDLIVSVKGMENVQNSKKKVESL